MCILLPKEVWTAVNMEKFSMLSVENFDKDYATISQIS